MLNVPTELISKGRFEHCSSCAFFFTRFPLISFYIRVGTSSNIDPNVSTLNLKEPRHSLRMLKS